MIQQFVLKNADTGGEESAILNDTDTLGGGIHKEWVLFWTQAEEDNLHPRPLAEPHCVPAVVGNIDSESTRIPPWWGLLGVASMWKWVKGQAEVSSLGFGRPLFVQIHTPAVHSRPVNSTSWKSGPCLHSSPARVVTPPLQTSQFAFRPTHLLSSGRFGSCFSPHFTPHHHCLTSNAASSLEFLIVISIHSLSPATATNSNPEVFNVEAPFVCGFQSPLMWMSRDGRWWN